MRRSSLFLISCIPLSLLTGCPAEPEPESETAAATTSATEATATEADPGTETSADTGTETGTDGIPGCECIVDEDDENPPEAPSLPTCGESVCPEVMAAEAGDGGSGSLEVSNPEALTCALTALRDRTPGIVTWDWSDAIGQFQDDGYILIMADGTAVRRNYGWQDLSYIASDAELGPLEAPEHYTECLANASPQAQFDCLTANLAATATCDEGFLYDSF